MKALLSLALCAAALFIATHAHATLICAEIEAETYYCVESINDAGQYVWRVNPGDGAIAPLADDATGEPSNAAYFVCGNKYAAPASVGGILVQDVWQVDIEVGMPLFGLLGGITHTTIVECRSESPDPPALVEDPICKKRDETSNAKADFIGRTVDIGGGGLRGVDFSDFSFGGWTGMRVGGSDMGIGGPIGRIKRCEEPKG
jgi:hypothetical protein